MVSLDDAFVVPTEPGLDLVALDDALNALAGEAERLAEPWARHPEPESWRFHPGSRTIGLQ